MNYISDESNIFFYLLTFALGTIILLLLYYGSRYRKTILDLFRKQNIEPERDINEEWRPYLNSKHTVILYLNIIRNEYLRPMNKDDSRYSRAHYYLLVVNAKRLKHKC